MSPKRKHVLLLASAVAIMAAGCKTKAPPPPAPSEPGYKAFPTARKFDPPGQMYRVDKQGVTYSVTTLNVKIHKDDEVIPTTRGHSEISLAALLQTVGATACVPAGNAGVTRTANVNIESTDGLREVTHDDSGILKLAAEWLAKNGYDPASKYYVIRETISTKKVKYSADTGWLAYLGVEACVEQAAKADAQLDFVRGASVELDRTFTENYRIWYKPERLAPQKGPGIGPNNIPIFDLVQAPEFAAPVREADAGT